MIELIKKSASWKEWEVVFKGTNYLLGTGHAIAVDEELYNFPVSRDCNIYLEDINKLTFLDLPKELYLCLDNFENNLGQGVQQVWIDCRFNKVKLSYSWGGSIDTWEDFLNPLILRREIFKILVDLSENNSKIIVHDITEHDAGYVDLFFEFSENIESGIGQALNKIKTQLDEAYTLAKERVIKSDFHNSLIAKFSFNPVVQDACTRYLHFFIEFLKDMGISADSSISNKGTEVLFSITPVDKNFSLAKVKEALALYLSLPEFDLGIYDLQHIDPVIELKIEKISAEISRLKADIKLNQAISKYESNYISSGRVYETNVINVDKTINLPLSGLKTVEAENKIETKEEFLGGSIKLGVLKIAGIELDWSKLLQRLKNIK